MVLRSLDCGGTTQGHHGHKNSLATSSPFLCPMSFASAIRAVDTKVTLYSWGAQPSTKLLMHASVEGDGSISTRSDRKEWIASSHCSCLSWKHAGVNFLLDWQNGLQTWAGQEQSPKQFATVFEARCSLPGNVR